MTGPVPSNGHDFDIEIGYSGNSDCLFVATFR